MKILFSWIAYNNNFIKEDGRFAVNNLNGPHYQFHKYFYQNRGYDNHTLLYAGAKQEGYAERLAIKLRGDFPTHQVEELLALQGIIHLEEVKTKVDGYLLKFEKDMMDYACPSSQACSRPWWRKAWGGNTQ
ncbi:hypothetical protein [Pontibacter actiniarum]|uniref:Uncharacterized protein n=1 Tax=Pontibacter actiniarum TaxID=323450 RepID=A0A1X9YP61_9BACT|nr:hypothetical protein [Pontibacter actiniarum]ARS34634.1 hypothetical protein CA264_03760 [Pontibacter actiniarum]